MPTVSVIMTSYNYAAYLGEALASVRAQTWSDWELLVVDDGSTDDSVAIIAEAARQDTRIRLLRHADGGNHGMPASLRLGLQAATGIFAAFLESDDAWRPDCLEQRLRLFSRSAAHVVFNAVEPVSGEGAASRRVRRYMAHLRLRFPWTSVASLTPHIWLGNVVPSFSCVMARRDVLAGCDFQAPTPAWLDWWLWLQLASTARFAYLDNPLTRWRLHAHSYSASITGTHGRRHRLLREACRLPGAEPSGLMRGLAALPGRGLFLCNAALLVALRARALACRKKAASGGRGA